MIGLDTNVVVRYLVQDEPKQAKLASRVIEKAIADGKTLMISLVTLCEIIWVLERCYKLTRHELIEVTRQLLQTKQIVVESEDVARQACLDFEHGATVDFSDCLIGRQNALNGCSFTYTFDKNAAKKLHASFRAISENIHHL